MPVLAQALDALCRQISKMNTLGDKMDARVRSRFNPVTWLAQQLLRRHPRAATTPRRMHIYRSFKDWADYERGRREMLRCKARIEEVFNGFKLKDGVGKNTLPTVISSIDDRFRLRGALKSNPHMQQEIKPDAMEPQQEAGTIAAAQPKKSLRRNSVLGGTAIQFDQFWGSFSNTIMKHDVISFSAITEGKRLLKLEEEQNARLEEEKILEAERRRQAAAEHQRLLGLYQSLYPKFQQNEVLKMIVDDGKILTGDFLKPTDPGFEIEVTPHGAHVVLLQELMVLLGYEARMASKKDKKYRRKEPRMPTFRSKVKHEPTSSKDEPSLSKKDEKKAEKRKSMLVVKNEEDAAPSAEEKTTPKQEQAAGEEQWWTPELKGFWKVLQALQGVTDPSGAVEREVLQAVTPPPDDFINLRKRVDMHFEVQAENGNEEDPIEAVARIFNKPTFEELARKVNMTRGRLDFFYEVFVGFLHQSDPSKQDAYPECPAALDKQTMFSLVTELQPDISEAEFEARFRRIDKDRTGLVEFDEFVLWVHDDEVALVGAGAKKMTFEELAQDYSIPLDLVKYIYDCFVHELEEGEDDHYPDKPATMPYDTIWTLVNILTPTVEKKTFDAEFKQLDVEKKGRCTFDEVLELLYFQALPTELQTRYGVTFS
eukprot:TRINITY_DN28762_c0_g1_i2.p1 TRINITY_DN28762_c0_g1~~TRINITY_DN28762_c0_g1_i2.p1  ORF type:complete len:654 (+),score=163.79 TRINITY_DN28762_c0_g1_i2:334-2295(+)